MTCIKPLLHDLLIWRSLLLPSSCDVQLSATIRPAAVPFKLVVTDEGEASLSDHQVYQQYLLYCGVSLSVLRSSFPGKAATAPYASNFRIETEDSESIVERITRGRYYCFIRSMIVS
jgi:hypothetical protein